MTETTPASCCRPSACHHPVVTEVCLIDLDRDEEQSFVDVARVRWGSVR